MKEETKNVATVILLFVVVFGLAGGSLIFFGINSMLEEHTQIGIINRVELLAGHVTSTQDKCVVAFDDGSTIVLDYNAFAEANKYVGKKVTMVYRNYGQIISIKED